MEENRKFTRNCPECNKELTYSTKSNMLEAQKSNRKCTTCGVWNRGLTKGNSVEVEEVSRKVSKAHKLRAEQGLSTWNKGLTKDTSDIVKSSSEKRIGYRHSEESKRKISEASKKHWGRDSYRQVVIERVTARIIELIPKWLATMEERGHFTPKHLKDEWELYKERVRLLTERNDLTKLTNYDKRGRADKQGGAYHLDHKFSITAGFLNGISPTIISHPCNLEFIPSRENNIKYTGCSIPKEELLELYQKYEKIN